MSDDNKSQGYKLFVGNIAWSVSNEDLQAHFEQVGEVISAFIVKDRETKRSRGFGFVEMATKEAADAAVEKLNESELDGRNIRVDHAQERD